MVSLKYIEKALLTNFLDQRLIYLLKYGESKLK
jgi:hypothetical protein